MADFVFNELGLTTAAAIHDGDPYTQGLAQAFADAFTALGGEITGFTGVNKEDTDMVPVLTEVAAATPQALFFPIFQPAGDFIADQAPGVSGLEDTVLLAADGLLVDGFLELAQSEGMYFSGPDTRFGENTNQSTGKTAERCPRRLRAPLTVKHRLLRSGVTPTTPPPCCSTPSRHPAPSTVTATS